MGNDELRSIARRLRDLVEPIAANVYFAPEATAEYEALGVHGFAPGYFPSRGGCLGQVPGEAIAAAFGVFKPAMVREAVVYDSTSNSISPLRMMRRLAAGTGASAGGLAAPPMPG